MFQRPDFLPIIFYSKLDQYQAFEYWMYLIFFLSKQQHSNKTVYTSTKNLQLQSVHLQYPVSPGKKKMKYA